MHPFQVMVEPIRRRIVEILASGEHPSGMITSMIQTEFGVTRAAVSRHLRILRETNWVIVRPDWNERLYRLDPDALDRLDEELRSLHHIWDRRIGSISGRTPQRRDAEPELNARNENTTSSSFVYISTAIHPQFVRHWAEE